MIAVGANADVVIWDDRAEVTVSNSMLHHDVDYTPYEGMKLAAWPAMTLSRGEIVWERPRFAAAKGRSRHPRCERPAPARPKAMHG